jgi:hypothetical protein
MSMCHPSRLVAVLTVHSSLIYQSRDLRSFNTLHSNQYAGIGDRGGISRQRLRVGCRSHLVYLPRLPLHRPQLLQLGVLDYSHKHRGQPDVLVRRRPGNEPYHLRLDPKSVASARSVSLFPCSSAVSHQFVSLPGGRKLTSRPVLCSSFAPLLYYKNTWYAAYLPMSTGGSFDNTDVPYNVTAIINPDLTLDEDLYKAYYPLFLSMTFATSYGLSFASFVRFAISCLSLVLTFRQSPCSHLVPFHRGLEHAALCLCVRSVLIISFVYGIPTHSRRGRAVLIPSRSRFERHHRVDYRLRFARQSP